jgi:hypothetical protein
MIATRHLAHTTATKSDVTMSDVTALGISGRFPRGVGAPGLLMTGRIALALLKRIGTWAGLPIGPRRHQRRLYRSDEANKRPTLAQKLGPKILA